jgi:hypothetical protein
MTVSPFRNFCLSVGFRCKKARSQEACLDPLLAWCWRYFGAIKPLKHAYQASLAGLWEANPGAWLRAGDPRSITPGCLSEPKCGDLES